MSLMFVAVTLSTSTNLLFIPFQLVPTLWGGIPAVAFMLMNAVADKSRLWSGVTRIIVAGITITLTPKGKKPGDELGVLTTVFASLVSAWYNAMQYRKEKHFRSRRSRQALSRIIVSHLMIAPRSVGEVSH